MMKKTKVIVTAALSCSIAMFGSLATADGHQGDDSRWYLTPMVGFQNFDSDRNLDDEATIGAGLEYRFGENWAAELSYMDSSPDVDSNAGGDVDLSQLHLDGLYYFNNDPDAVQPFLLAGLGHAEFDGGASEDNETQLSLGGGLRYNFNPLLSLKASLKAIYGHDDSTVDTLLNIGLSFAFGGGHSKPAVAKAQPAAVAKPAIDSDNDGVFDNVDRCPNTPAGREVDNNGCKYVLTRTEEIALNVQFATNSDVVPESYMAKIKAVAEFMSKYAGVEAVIEGHTDSRGKAEYNQNLSQRRADSVMSVLVNRYNVAAERLSAVGYGEEKPIASNDDADGRLENRRVIAVMKAQIEE